MIAPGIIVYERLLDAYLGKRREDGTRNFDDSDFKKFEALFTATLQEGSRIGAQGPKHSSIDKTSQIRNKTNKK